MPKFLPRYENMNSSVVIFGQALIQDWAGFGIPRETWLTGPPPPRCPGVPQMPPQLLSLTACLLACLLDGTVSCKPEKWSEWPPATATRRHHRRPRPDDDDASLGPANPSRVEMDARPLMQLQIIASLAPPAKKLCLPTASCCRGRPDCDILSPASLIMLPPRMDRKALPNHLRNYAPSMLALMLRPQHRTALA